MKIERLAVHDVCSQVALNTRDALPAVTETPASGRVRVPGETGGHAELAKTIRAAWDKALALLKKGQKGFSRHMEAAAMAEAGVPDMALERLSQRPEAPEEAERGSAPPESGRAPTPSHGASADLDRS